MNSVGQYVVVWSGYGNQAGQQDTDTSGVFFQRYSTALIVDTVADYTNVSGNWGDTSSIGALLSNRGADGKISLREAITAANNTANVGGPDRIYFNIAGAGPHTINLGSVLPDITQAIIIDGTSEPDFAGTPVIELNGAGAGAATSGLILASGSSGSTIRGLVINRFSESAIRILGSSNNTVAGNFLGTNTAGTAALGNQVGVYITLSSTNNTVGGTTAADRNIISGNTVDGVQVFGSGTQGNVVIGNYIGVDVTGTVDLGNTFQGVAIFNQSINNTIGGTAAGAGNVVRATTAAGSPSPPVAPPATLSGELDRDQCRRHRRDCQQLLRGPGRRLGGEQHDWRHRGRGRQHHRLQHLGRRGAGFHCRHRQQRGGQFHTRQRRSGHRSARRQRRR